MFQFSSDKYLNNIIKKYLLFLFRYIHPNIITIFGLVTNILIFYFYYNNLLIFIILNFLRIIFDNLDGMIAREFNKCSKIGGYLDTLCDVSHILIISYFIISDYLNIKYIFLSLIIIFFIIFFYLYNLNSLSNHDNLYNRLNYRYMDYIPVFISKNTYLSIFLFNLFIIKYYIYE